MKITKFGEMPQVEIVPAKEERVETISIRQFFDFEKLKVQPLTLNQLAHTNRENRGDDNSPMHGIYHFALIKKLLDMCEEYGYDAEVYDLFATNNRDKQTPGVSLYPELEAKYGTRAVEAHTLRRVYANIRLTDFDNNELTTCMGVSFTQKGIQVGFGSTVKICHNLNFLGEGQFVADYKICNHFAKGECYKTDLKGILEKVGTWLSDAEHIMIRDRETIEKMKETVLTAEQIYMIIGMLTSMRVACDTRDKKIKYSGNIYPLNQTQIGQFTEKLLIKQHDEGRITAWSLYNAATDLYKPQTAETTLILPQNLRFVEFMKDNEIF